MSLCKYDIEEKKMKNNKMNKKWNKKLEQLYQDLCLDDFDEEGCYSIIERADDSDWDDGIPDEIRYM